MKEIFTSIRRTPYQSLGSFMILFFTLFLAIFFFNLTAFFHGLLSYVETRPQVIVYFDVDAQENDILNMKSKIENSGLASSVTYKSQEDALQIYRELNSDNPRLLEMVSAQILPSSLEIFALKPEYLSEIAQSFDGIDIVDEVNYQEEIVERLVVLTTILRRVTIGLFSMLVFVSMTVLLTTTAFKISVKKDEIEVLQLMGASKGYIRRPFLSEGIFFGFLTATIATGLYYAIFYSFLPFLKSYLSGVPSLPFLNLIEYNLYVFPPSLEFVTLSYVFILLFGIGIAYVGNLLATSKYIK